MFREDLRKMVYRGIYVHRWGGLLHFQGERGQHEAGDTKVFTTDSQTEPEIMYTLIKLLQLSQQKDSLAQPQHLNIN